MQPISTCIKPISINFGTENSFVRKCASSRKCKHSDEFSTSALIYNQFSAAWRTSSYSNSSTEQKECIAHNYDWIVCVCIFITNTLHSTFISEIQYQLISSSHWNFFILKVNKFSITLKTSIHLQSRVVSLGRPPNCRRY